MEVCLGGGAVLLGLRGVAVDGEPAEPFLRWAGGKRKLFGEIVKRLDPDCSVMERPSFDAYVAADVNPNLVAAWRAVRDDVEEVVRWLKLQPQDTATFAVVRAEEMATETGRGTRAIWLNLHAHGGLWRVNSKGLFNVPPQLDRFVSVDLDAVATKLRRISALIQHVNFSVADFSTTLGDCGDGDVVYCDPPYLPDETSQFVGYAKGTKKEALALHRNLASLAGAAAQRGARVVVSNSPAAREIFETELRARRGIGFTVDTVTAQRSIGVGKSAATKRRVDEILVVVDKKLPQQ